MSVSLPNGSTVAIASGYGSANAFSTISNATEAVISDADHTFVNGDIVEITSGWVRLNNRIARVKSVSAGVSYTLEGVDTSNTTRFPPGGGAGSARKVSGFQQITQILGSNSNGGEQQFKSYKLLEEGEERRIPTSKSARGYSFEVADDTAQPHYAILTAADEDRAPRAIRLAFANGGYSYMNCYVTMNPEPTLTVDEIMALEVTLSLLAKSTRYTA